MVTTHKMREVPFQERFREVMLNGTKVQTARTDTLAWPTERFEAFGATFEIDQVYLERLAVVANAWQPEGCESKEDFIDLWNKLHPRKRFDPGQQVHVHKFHKVVTN